MKIFAIVFVLLVAAGIYIGTFIVLLGKRKKYLLAFLCGSATFFVFQIILRLPLLTVLNGMAQVTIFKITNPWLWSLILGASAALFEEGGRWLVMGFFLKKHRTAKDGFVFGIGHGGFEAIALIAPSYIVTLFVAQSPLWQAADSLIYMAGIERIFAIMFHIGASVMVMKSVREKKIRWLIIAFLLHTLLDSGIGFMQQMGVSTLGIEGFVGLVGIAMFIYAIYSVRNKKIKVKEES